MVVLQLKIVAVILWEPLDIKLQEPDNTQEQENQK